MNFFFIRLIVVLMSLVGIVVHAAPVSPTAAPTAWYIRSVAGVGTIQSSGDDGPATSASFGQVWGVWSDTTGNLFMTEATAYKVRKIDTSGIITRYIGSGSQSLSGASAPATSVGLDGVFCIYGDTSGNIYFSSRAFFIWRYEASSAIVSRFAGATPAAFGYSGDGGQATAATLSGPMGLFLTTSGILYFTDSLNNRIRAIDTSTGIISLVAGTGNQSPLGDNGPATSAGFYNPFGVFVTTSSIMYIADTYNSRVRQITLSNGIITTVAGTGTTTYNGDNIPATTATINNPYTVGTDTLGNLFIADPSGTRIRKVSNGIITTVIGTGSGGQPTDGLVTNTTPIDSPAALFVTSLGSIYISEGYYIKQLFIPMPTAIPTRAPTYSPSRVPTTVPTFMPSKIPTRTPSASPTVTPTVSPTSPTVSPSASPSAAPTQTPTVVPSVVPSVSPSVVPSQSPTAVPTMTPSFLPSVFPTDVPTALPTTSSPTAAPTISPSNEPTLTMSPSSLRPNAFNVTNASSKSSNGFSNEKIFYVSFFPALFVLICIGSLFFYFFCFKNRAKISGKK